ncbi:extracellular solute-binding protein [Acidisoma cellulosilytica]|uniref:Extracellular solute-binding protein n=1 Tax=Acidisoma cellulosilyticum TaxID=2802395 RepID=A0A964E564_9PROT|nr:extracellular solute-binding protein [Acidisoma cellulosilyticum]MCB8882077.1 extracellular solute-binding protein [Acidisoma cellulosilyticum]
MSTTVLSALASIGIMASHVATAAAATVKVAYSLDYFMASPELTTKWFTGVKTQFETEHPGDTLQLIPIPGGYDDFTTKLSLLFNSHSTAPDIVQYAAVSVGQFAASDLLAPLDKQLETSSWWKTFPEPVKAEGMIDGKVYGVAEGENDYGLVYDRTLLSKAGLPHDWSPKTWQDILDAARAIKKAAPNSWPIWLMTGTSQGTYGVVAGAGVLLAAASNPTVLDPATNKWVVDSKGIREVLAFYRDASAEGLLAPSAQILDPNAGNNTGPLVPQHKIGIVFSGNWVPEDWSKTINQPYWPDPDKVIGFAPVPTSAGQTPGTGGSFGGWDLSVYKKSPHPDLAWDAVNIMQQEKNMLDLAANALVIPPVPAYTNDAAYLAMAEPPFQTDFAHLLYTEKAMPASAEFPVWAYAFQQATETMVLKPKTSIDDAVKAMKAYVSQQLGADRVEVMN